MEDQPYSYLKISSRCIACDLCRTICPSNAIIKNKSNFYIESWACTLCDICVTVCPVSAIKLVEMANQYQENV